MLDVEEGGLVEGEEDVQQKDITEASRVGRLQKYKAF